MYLVGLLYHRRDQIPPTISPSTIITAGLPILEGIKRYLTPLDTPALSGSDLKSLVQLRDSAELIMSQADRLIAGKRMPITTG